MQTSFPVFEADQVLTNNHLNDLRRYLDEQNRLTRNKLIGAGIVCGLQVTASPATIHVSKGCGLTSQGQLILLCDKDYTHAIPYAPLDLPEDIDFITQCSGKSSSRIPFYKPDFGESLLQLLTGAEVEQLPAERKSDVRLFSDFTAQEKDALVVVLFLETEQLRLKNCDTNDCNDKGSRMDFEPKALLVSKAVLDEVAQEAGMLTTGGSLPHIPLKRYNVPVANLLNTTAVLSAFAAIADDETINRIEDAFSKCFERYRRLLQETSNPFGGIANRLKATRQTIQSTNLLFIQYFYDYLDDLSKAYDEFCEKAAGVSSECCLDEMLFPLHLMLGEADSNTLQGQLSSYRQYFIYSPLLDSQSQRLEELRFLFTRLKLLTQRFSPDDPSRFLRREIKLTPSVFGKAWLSDRAIPYYYPTAANGGPALFQVWNYKKSVQGEAASNLSYNAADYAGTNRPVTEPLLYDLERFNFFRVEGHIGKQVSTALTDIVRIKQEANLPIEVIALSADYIGAILKGEDPQCVIQDLESDYRIIIAEFMCKLHDAFCSIYSFDFRPRPVLATPVSLEAPRGRRAASKAATKSATAKAAAAAAETSLAAAVADTPEDDEEVAELMSKMSFEGLNINHPVLSRLVAEAQLTKAYVKGSSLQRICGVRKGSIGEVYLSNIVDNRFVNPISLNTNIRAASLYFRFFELIDSIESMFRILLTHELSELDMTEFKVAYARYEKAVTNLSKQLSVITDKVQVFLSTCIVEKLEALKDEYNRRLNQFVLARKFNNYLRQHGGVEHKAGVTKGGTFILVYYEETRVRRFDVSALFVNKSLGALMLARHPDLLQNDLDEKAVKVATDELATAVALQCPENYTYFNNTVKAFLATDTTIPAASREALLAAIRRPPERRPLPFASGTVIADFYVPYLCCSDCSPVMYVLPPPPPQDDTQPPTIKIDKDSFCSDDSTRFPINVAPGGGTVTGPGVSLQADGRFVFTPAVAGPGSHTLTYTLNGKAATVQVQVAAAPKPSFSFTTRVQDGVMFVELKNESQATTDQTVYEWLLDGLKFSDKKDPEPIQFKVQSLPHTIGLRESNGQCPAGPVEKRIAAIEKRELAVCRSVKEMKLEPNLPANAEVKILLNEGNILDDKLVIHPSATNAAQTTVFNVSYSIADRQIDVAITVIVVDANFNMNLTRATATTHVPPVMMTLSSVSTSLSSSVWELRQGTNAFTNVVEGQPFALSAGNFNSDQPILVTHIAETAVINTVCRATASFELSRDMIAKHLNKGVFTNTDA